MTSITDLGAQAWRDFETDGVPSSGARNTPKSDARAVMAAIDLQKADDISIDLDGAVGDRSTNNLTAVNDAITRIGLGELPVPHGGDYVVNSLPTNPNGVRLTGDGKVLLPETGGFRQLNTYADRDLLVGREYLYRAFRRLSLGPAGGTAQLKMFVYGDSTVEGYVAAPASIATGFLVQNLLPVLFAQQGVHNVSVTNRGVSSTSWTHLDAIPDLGAATDLIIIKYGINDGVPTTGVTTIKQRIDRMSALIRSKLAAIRADAFGDLDSLSILLVGPNSTNDTPNGRNEEWYEQVRNVYVQAARDYQCAFFDTYAYMRDARAAPLLWMDEPWADGRTVHPLDVANVWIWGKVIGECFPREEVAYWATNNFSSYGSTAGAVASTKLPSAYRFGMTWELAETANGFPVNGLLVTYRNPDTYAVQFIYPLSSDRRTFQRYASSGSAWDTVWAGEKVTLTLENSWVAYGGSEVAPSAFLSSSGLVVLSGILKDGTTAANTRLTTLPEGYRPYQNHRFSVMTAAGTIVGITVAPIGYVTLIGTGNATWTALDGVVFPAA
jgi:lysophospholipase L1-like esterase